MAREGKRGYYVTADTSDMSVEAECRRVVFDGDIIGEIRGQVLEDEERR